jgi:hypothetical protein
MGHYGEVLDILRYIVLKNAIRLLELRVSEAEVCLRLCSLCLSVANPAAYSKSLHGSVDLVRWMGVHPEMRLVTSMMDWFCV